MGCNPLFVCVRLCVRLFSGPLVDRDGYPFRLSDGVQVNFSGTPVFMPENFLDRPDGNVVVLPDRRSRMSEGMKPEIFDACLCAQSLHKSFSILVRALLQFSSFAAVVSVPKDPWHVRISTRVPS